MQLEVHVPKQIDLREQVVSVGKITLFDLTFSQLMDHSLCIRKHQKPYYYTGLWSPNYAVYDADGSYTWAF